MEIVLYSQYYLAPTSERQHELDECLRRNLNHPGISRVVLFCEPDAPSLPKGTVPVQVVSSASRLTYATWFSWIKRQGSGIGLLLNADIYLDQGVEHLERTFDAPDLFLALTRYNPGRAGFHLNDFPHWTQDVWGVRADAEIPDSLLHASGFPLGFPGCDNRIAYVMWSHGFRVCNPCYHVRSVHLHASPARSYDKTSDRLYGGVSYVHPSLAPDEDAELEFALWTRSAQRPSGVLINQQAIEEGVHELRHSDVHEAQNFLDQQQFTSMSWVHEALGSAHLQGDLKSLASEDTMFLSLPTLLTEGIELQLLKPAKLEGLMLRLPRRAGKGYLLELEAIGEAGSQLLLRGSGALVLKPGGERRFWQSDDLKRTAWQRLRLKLSGPAIAPAWQADEGAELVLFAEAGVLTEAKSLTVTALEPQQQRLLVAGTSTVESAQPAYQWRRRRDCLAELDMAEELHCFSQRFRVLRSGDQLLFDDRFWPSIGVSPIASVPCGLNDARGLLLWGFGQPALELVPDFITTTKRFSDDLNFWQYPCLTEQDAFAVHQSLLGPVIKDGALQLYIGLPWATWIDCRHWPTATLMASAERVRMLRVELKKQNLGLKVHSVCQHIFWRENLHLIKASGVDCLWLSHKPKGEDQLEGVELKPWHLYAVNCRDPDRRQSLMIRPAASKPWLAAFVGAHMDHYITDVRPRLMQFKDLHRFYIDIKDDWHFNPIVYGIQEGHEGSLDKVNKSTEEDCNRYNLILSDSQFSLCPAGAGPNSLRLWESLAVGSIPVILSDHLALPDLTNITDGRWKSWDEIVIFHPEEDLNSLPERLAAISTEEIEQRSAAGISLMKQLNRFSCLGMMSDREVTSVELETEPDLNKPRIVIPVYGPTDRYYWRQKKHGFYDVVLEWYLRGKVRIAFGDKGYFWWGGEGDVLLMERDLVIELHDRKVDPPRWEGEVPYKHAFFFNQYHQENSRNHKATYFTYAPAHLEQMRQRLGRVGWEERKHASIFAGSIENETQEFFRNRFKGWEDVIEIYSCTDRLNQKQPHTYSIEDYLQLVAHSRFGVCFRGNGPKCFREMEYLALGTPLIITPGVEVNYPSPITEGIHYFYAETKDDITKIVQKVTSQQWEIMSKACWDWFEKHGTIDRMFSELTSQISRLDLNYRRHRVVRILTPRDKAETCLAVKSLNIVDPLATWIAQDDKGKAELSLDPDSLVINELPFVHRETDYTWNLKPHEQKDFCESIAISDLEVHKQLLSLMQLRLPNFRIKIHDPSGEISLWERRTELGLQLNSAEERATLLIDFDWTRRCSETYKERAETITGPGLVTFPCISATLWYRKNGQTYMSSLSSHFNEYYAMNNELIPEKQVLSLCKLWRYEDAEPERVDIEISAIQGSTPIQLSYHNLS